MQRDESNEPIRECRAADTRSLDSLAIFRMAPFMVAIKLCWVCTHRSRRVWTTCRLQNAGDRPSTKSVVTKQHGCLSRQLSPI